MKSIIQDDITRCYICGQNACGDPLDKHHIWGAANRNKSEKYGLYVYVHHNKCHIFGKKSVHQNAEINNSLKAKAQKIAMNYYDWTVNDFISMFGKNNI